LLLAQHDPLLIRASIQQNRDLVASDVSKLRKVLDLAKLDTYEMYKMYRTLQVHENSSVMLQLLKVLESNDEAANDVLDVLNSVIKPQF